MYTGVARLPMCIPGNPTQADNTNMVVTLTTMGCYLLTTLWLLNLKFEFCGYNLFPTVHIDFAYPQTNSINNSIRDHASILRT